MLRHTSVVLFISAVLIAASQVALPSPGATGIGQEAEPQGSGAGGHAAGEDKGHAAKRLPVPIPADLYPHENLAARIFAESVPTVVEIRATSSRGAGRASLGTGVLIHPDCHVLTAAHVVDGADSIIVLTSDGAQRKAERVFSEPGADIALIRLVEPDETLPHAELGTSASLVVGQDLFVIGNPRGLSNTFTKGILSGFRDFAQLYDGSILVQFLQTDAAINSGNSGGPIFDSGGKLVGIASRISTQSGGSEGLGFAVTIDSIKQLLALEGRTWTGIQAIYLSSADLQGLFHLGLPGALLVQSVEAASPAAKAGLRGGSVPATIAGREILLGGDLIVEFAGQESCHAGCLAQARTALGSKGKIKAKVLRGNRMIELTLDVSESRRNFLGE